MPPYRPRMIGPDHHTRYVIVDRRGRYWCGWGWSKSQGHARIYFDYKHVERTINQLTCSTNN